MGGRAALLPLALVACFLALPVQSAESPAFNPRDFTGMWAHPGGARDAVARLNAPRIERPESGWSSARLPLTAEGRKVFEANKPTGGPRQVKGEVSPNDPRDTGNWVCIA